MPIPRENERPINFEQTCFDETDRHVLQGLLEDIDAVPEHQARRTRRMDAAHLQEFRTLLELQ